MKGLLEMLVARLAGARLVYETTLTRERVEHPGRTATVTAVLADGSRLTIGRVGELHPGLLAAYDVRADHVVFAEIDLDGAGAPAPASGSESVAWKACPAWTAISPWSCRPSGPPARWRPSSVSTAAHTCAVVRLFDQYRGAPLGEGERSLAYRLRFEALDGALSEADVDGAVERVVGVLSERLGARLRA